MSGTLLLGCSLRPGSFPTVPSITTQHQADVYWTTAQPNGLGLPLQAGKVFYSGTGSSNWPTTIGAMEQAFINDGVGMFPIVYPTFPFVAAEVTALLNMVNMFTNAGGIIPGVCIGNEVNSGRQYTSAQYLNLVQNFQSIRSTVPIWMSASGYNQTTQAAYFGATNAGLHDGIQVDYYDGTFKAGRDLTTAASLADAAGIPLGLGEMGNNVDGPGITSNFTAYMSFLQSFFGARAQAGKQMGPFMWYQGTGPNSGGSWIQSPSDPRIPIILAFQSAVSATPPGPTGPYDVGSISTNVAGTTLVIPVGSGSVGKPQGTSAGDLVYVAISAINSGQSISSVVDSKGNTYAQVNSYAAGSSQNQWLWASKTTNALVAGTDTITITYAVSVNSRSAIARGCPGVTSATRTRFSSSTGTATRPARARPRRSRTQTSWWLARSPTALPLARRQARPSGQKRRSFRTTT